MRRLFVSVLLVLVLVPLSLDAGRRRYESQSPVTVVYMPRGSACNEQDLYLSRDGVEQVLSVRMGDCVAFDAADISVRACCAGTLHCTDGESGTVSAAQCERWLTSTGEML